MGFIRKSYSGRRTPVMFVTVLLNLAASLLDAPDWVCVGSIVAMVTEVIWTLAKPRRGEESA